MNLSVTVPNEVMERVLRDAMSTLDLDAVTLVDAKKAAELLKLTPRAFKEVARDFFDFGERRTRWSVAELRELIESRRVKSTRK